MWLCGEVSGYVDTWLCGYNPFPFQHTDSNPCTSPPLGDQNGDTALPGAEPVPLGYQNGHPGQRLLSLFFSVPGVVRFCEFMMW